MKKIIKYTWFLLRSILILLLLWAILASTVKNILTNIKIEQFKSKGVYQEEMSSSFIKYYKIEGDEEKAAFQKIGNVIYPGSPGDIIASAHSSIQIPIIQDIISFYAGGHAAIVTNNYADYKKKSSETTIIEAPGLDAYPSPARIESTYYWTNNNLFSDCVVLRVKMTDEELNEVMAYCQTFLGDPYNYSFLFDTTNKTYCSDLVSKTFSKINKNLNKDSMATTIQDLINSDETYITYYHYFDGDVKYIYYLD